MPSDSSGLHKYLIDDLVKSRANCRIAWQ